MRAAPRRMRRLAVPVQEMGQAPATRKKILPTRTMRTGPHSKEVVRKSRYPSAPREPGERRQEPRKFSPRIRRPFLCGRRSGAFPISRAAPVKSIAGFTSPHPGRLTHGTPEGERSCGDATEFRASDAGKSDTRARREPLAPVSRGSRRCNFGVRVEMES